MDTQDKKDDDSWMSGVELGHTSIEKTGKNDIVTQGASPVNFKFKINEVGIIDHGSSVKTVGKIVKRESSYYQKRRPSY